MTPRKLAKIRLKLASLYASPQGIRSGTLVSLAEKLGRTRSKRGSEPNYVREDAPLLSPPLSIPQHANKDMPMGTARSVIDALLSDVDEWEIHLMNTGNEDERDDC